MPTHLRRVFQLCALMLAAIVGALSLADPARSAIAGALLGATGMAGALYLVAHGVRLAVLLQPDAAAVMWRALDAAEGPELGTKTRAAVAYMSLAAQPPKDDRQPLSTSDSFEDLKEAADEFGDLTLELEQATGTRAPPVWDHLEALTESLERWRLMVELGELSTLPFDAPEAAEAEEKELRKLLAAEDGESTLAAFRVWHSNYNARVAEKWEALNERDRLQGFIVNRGLSVPPPIGGYENALKAKNVASADALALVTHYQEELQKAEARIAELEATNQILAERDTIPPPPTNPEPLWGHDPDGSAAVLAAMNPGDTL